MSTAKPYDARRNTRTALLVGFGLAAFVAVLTFGTFGALRYVTHHVGDGFLSSPTLRVDSSGYAVRTEPLHIEDGGATAIRALLGRLRLEARPRGGRPLFVGIGRASDVQRYLGGVEHSSLREIDDGDPVYERHPGERRPSVPGRHTFWVAASNGDAGTPRASWRARAGRYEVVVMNADASRGVHAKTRVAARLPVLGWLSWGVLGFAILVTLGAVLLLVLALRVDVRPRTVESIGLP